VFETVFRKAKEMNQVRFEIFRGRELNGTLTQLRICGYAFQNEGENYYKIKLFTLSDQIFYMSKNMSAGYTLFAKMVVHEDGKTTFQNPVGFAKLMDHIRTHIYVKFSDLGSNMYMSLYPSGNDLAA
jgi:hypothetical protein